MTAPTLDDVRDYLERRLAITEQVAESWDTPNSAQRQAATIRLALAALDDAERLDWLDGKALDGVHVEVWAKGNADVRVEREACCYWRNSEVRAGNVRAAIDAARQGGA